MSIPLKYKLKHISRAIRFKGNLAGNNEDWVVWWYSGIYKNNSAESQPNVLIAFRVLSSDTLSDSVIYRRVPLTSLGQFRIGTVWKNSMCHSEIIFDSPKKSFLVDFTKGAWKLISFQEAAKNGDFPPYPMSAYQLLHDEDKNWLIEFPLQTGGKLLIPCIEFFSRCYGRSEELKRVLATYSWDGSDKDSVQKRLYAQLDEPEEPGKWKVKLKRRLTNGDVILLAHAKYERYTANAAKKIYSQIEAQYDPKNKYPAFIKVAPWFQGSAQLSVNGIWFDDKRSFLALQVIGCSDPSGVPIQRDRENGNKVNGADEQGGDAALQGKQQYALTKPHEIIDLTGDDEPDHGGAAIEIQDPDFVVLGVPRVVIDVRKDRANGSAGAHGKGDNATVFSSGEAHGSEKGVGYASIKARPVMESNGMLRDMWNALLHLKKKYPDAISSVEWFTFDDGFMESDEPRLVGLEAFDETDEVDTDIRNWLFFDTKMQMPRGFLVARVTIKDKLVYLAELQRRPRIKTEEDGKKTPAEESFKGLIFMLNKPEEFIEWLKFMRSQVRHVKGIVDRLVSGCPGIAGTFSHRAAKKEEVPCEAAAINAFSKIGVIIGGCC